MKELVENAELPLQPYELWLHESVNSPSNKKPIDKKKKKINNDVFCPVCMTPFQTASQVEDHIEGCLNGESVIYSSNNLDKIEIIETPKLQVKNGNFLIDIN